MPKYHALILVFCVLLISAHCGAETCSLIPAGHWSYSAMAELTQSGLIPGYNNVNGDILTRLEMAYYLKKAIAGLEDNVAGTPPISSAVSVNQLIKEFAPELRLLGVNITDLANLTPSVKISEADEGFFDLDVVLSSTMDFTSEAENKLRIEHLQEPYYLMGEYHSPDLLDNVFFFLPEDWLTTNDPPLLHSNNRWDIMYTPKGNLELYFLVLRGVFPVEFQSVDGFFLFPLHAGNDRQKLAHIDLEHRVYNLLNKLSQNYEVNNLKQFKGTVPMPELLSWDPLRPATRLEIGDYLVLSNFNEGLNPEHSYYPTKATETNFSLDLDLYLNTYNNLFAEGSGSNGSGLKSYGNIGGKEAFANWDSLLRSAAASGSSSDSSAVKPLKLPVFQYPWEKNTERSRLLMNLQINTLFETAEETETRTLQF